AFHHNRESLAAQGVHYVGRNRQPMRGVTAVTSRTPMIGDRQPSMAHWERLVREFRDADAPRVVLSSEFFADAQDDDDVRVIMDELGRERAHIVVTLRPLARILASQWQQYVQNGLRSSYDQWLESMFDEPPYVRPTPSFWRRHRHDRLVARWVAQVGAENVTVVVVDDSDRTMVTRTFEEMLGLAGGTLVPEPDRHNRSLTYAEAELVRTFNGYFKEHRWPPRLYSRLIRHGAVTEMKRRRTGERDTPVTTPPWAVERAVTVGAAAAEAIGRSGVRVVGDLAVLGHEPPPEPDRPEPLLAPEVASRALVGAIAASGAVERYRVADAPKKPKKRGPYVHELTTAQLLGVIGGRVRRRLTRGGGTS
ncbi:MAG: hypothetical protein ACRDO8_11630, partial [Nocardioidaceae bacterium]